MNTPKPTQRAQARSRERQMLHDSAVTHFRPLGSFVSSTPRAQLLGALKQFKPQLNTRLRELERSPYAHHYEVQVDERDLQQQRQIDLWLCIKGALTSAFPAHTPGAVTGVEP